MREILGRMEKELDQEDCQKILTEVAHGLPADYWKAERERFEEADDIDDYIAKKRARSIGELEKYNKSGESFFGQEITDEVLAYVKSRSDMLSGERRGNKIYHTKIPYDTKNFLAATDEKMKRYYACHCAWAREAIRSGEEGISADFCYCSGGFTKRPWEQAFGQYLDVEMVKSVLKGDNECSFVIPIPDEFLKGFVQLPEFQTDLDISV